MCQNSPGRQINAVRVAWSFLIRRAPHPSLMFTFSTQQEGLTTGWKICNFDPSWEHVVYLTLIKTNNNIYVLVWWLLNGSETGSEEIQNRTHVCRPAVHLTCAVLYNSCMAVSREYKYFIHVWHSLQSWDLLGWNPHQLNLVPLMAVSPLRGGEKQHKT